MNRIHLIPPAISSDGFNTAMAAAFQISLPSDTMHIPPACGEGSVYRKKIQDGLFLIFWEYTLQKRLSVHKKADPPGEKQQFISISYVFPAGHTTKTNPPHKHSFHPGYGNNFSIVAGNASIQFEVPKGEQAKIISLLVDVDWLKTEFAAGDIFYGAGIDAILQKTSTNPLQFAATPDDIQLLSEIADQLHANSDCLLFLKAKTFLLIAGLFSRILHLPVQHKGRENYLHYNQMMTLENIIISHLEKKLPDLPTLAKTMSLSPSTLKRNFKLVFGKNIHQYYVEQKMNYAMKILTEKYLSVNEVAHLLKYENVSGFIAMFKKHHGISPGSVARPAQKITGDTSYNLLQHD